MIIPERNPFTVTHSTAVAHEWYEDFSSMFPGCDPTKKGYIQVLGGGQFIKNGTAKANGAPNYNSAMLSLMPNTDLEGEFWLASADGGVVFRTNGTTNGYFVWANVNSSIGIYKLSTTMNNYTCEVTSTAKGNHFTFTIIKNTITLWDDYGHSVSWADTSPIASGNYLGFYYGSGVITKAKIRRIG